MKDLTLKLYCKAKAFAADKEGATAIEYAVIAGLIGVVIIAGARILGTDISTMFTNIGGSLPTGTAP
ncbi:Flp family type IVb pilin [Pseudomonas sp. SCB32]|uniref:Flp family type IVb pilin n=1 Tax=Pseudomonas sp. SCB32 TaxID=2653853 RepID=UPI00126568F4|nr:Flp family type IVb pilin [Pseudomonas sp. SCB32]